MWRAVGALLVAGVLLVTACTSGSGTAATPHPNGAAAPAGIELPPRPRDVPIDGVDPCALLTPEQRAELGLDGRPVFDAAPSPLYFGGDVPACTIGGFEPRAITAGVGIVTSAGVERYTSGEVAAGVRSTEVQGFPAVVAVPTRLTDFCTIIVDVAPGQLLDVQFADGGREPPIPQPELCRGAKQVAESVMTTLLTLR